MITDSVADTATAHAAAVAPAGAAPMAGGQAPGIGLHLPRPQRGYGNTIGRRPAQHGAADSVRAAHLVPHLPYLCLMAPAALLVYILPALLVALFGAAVTLLISYLSSNHSPELMIALCVVAGALGLVIIIGIIHDRHHQWHTARRRSTGRRGIIIRENIRGRSAAPLHEFTHAGPGDYVPPELPQASLNPQMQSSNPPGEFSVVIS